MKLLSLVIIAALISANSVSFAQQKTSKPSRSSANALLNSPVKNEKDDTVKVNVVNSIPIIISPINDPTTLKRNDTLSVNIVSSETQVKKWQYSFDYIDTNGDYDQSVKNHDFLNERGADGWDLAGVSFVGTGKTLLIFKKPL